jgi:hypothetical protein
MHACSVRGVCCQTLNQQLRTLVRTETRLDVLLCSRPHPPPISSASRAILYSTRLRKMSKRYALGVKRYVSVKKQDGELTVTIAEDGSEKSAILPARRWVRFVAAMNDAEENLKRCWRNNTSSSTSHGRRVVLISNDGIPVRGPTKMVLRRSHKRNQTKQDRHHTQNQRMECTERRHSTNSPEISGAVDDADVHKSTRKLQPGGSNLVFRMQSLSVRRNVKFDECVTVYKLDD